MGKVKYEVWQLFDAVNSIHEISSCSKCGGIDNVSDCDERDAVEHFFNLGWRVTPKGNLYCPKCAKKYLKTK